MTKSIFSAALVVATLCAAQAQSNEAPKEAFKSCFVTEDSKGNRFVICPGAGEQVVVFEDMEQDIKQEVASTNPKASAR